MEVSSHALVMGRVDGVVFDVAVFLNLGRDHLDFHTDLEDYFRAKASLFTPERTRLGLVDVGRRPRSPAGGRGDRPVRTFSAAGADADWRAEDVEVRADGSSFTVVTPDGTRLQAACPLPGRFNVVNTPPGSRAAAEVGLDPVAVAAGIAAAAASRRLERVDAGQDFVVVDYAHKPDAVEAAIGALRPLTDGRVIVVLGPAATGTRQATHHGRGRVPAGRRAGRYRRQPARGPGGDPYRAAGRCGRCRGRSSRSATGGRRSARRCATARPGDIVLVAGKGHETGQRSTAWCTFDDREVARGAGVALQ